MLKDKEESMVLLSAFSLFFPISCFSGSLIESSVFNTHTCTYYPWFWWQMSVLLKQNSINEQIKELCLRTVKDDVVRSDHVLYCSHTQCVIDVVEGVDGLQDQSPSRIRFSRPFRSVNYTLKKRLLYLTAFQILLNKVVDILKSHGNTIFLVLRLRCVWEGQNQLDLRAISQYSIIC